MSKLAIGRVRAVIEMEAKFAIADIDDLIALGSVEIQRAVREIEVLIHPHLPMCAYDSLSLAEESLKAFNTIPSHMIERMGGDGP